MKDEGLLLVFGCTLRECLRIRRLFGGVLLSFFLRILRDCWLRYLREFLTDFLLCKGCLKPKVVYIYRVGMVWCYDGGV